MTFDVAEINRRFKAAFSEAVAKYGSPSAIPAEEAHLLGERMRAEHVVAIHGKADPQVLRSYSLPTSIILELCGEVPEVERRQTRAAKRQAAERWCGENAGTTVAPQVLAEVAGFSYSTALAFIKERPDLFTRVKRGFYLVRDPEAERRQEV